MVDPYSAFRSLERALGANLDGPRHDNASLTELLDIQREDDRHASRPGDGGQMLGTLYVDFATGKEFFVPAVPLRETSADDGAVKYTSLNKES
jgi:hypothetical protein